MTLRHRGADPSNDTRKAVGAAPLSSPRASSSSAEVEDSEKDVLDCPWLRQLPYMPSRLRQVMLDPTLAISSRVCRDVVVRYPVTDAAEEEVMALVGHFGPAEYVSFGGASAAAAKKARIAKSFGAASGNEVSMDPIVPSRETGDSYCHYVRFQEGQDAIRCVLQLNGTVLDPVAHRHSMDVIEQVVEQQVQAHRQAVEENAVAADNDEEKLWEDLNDAVKRSREARNTIRCADPNAKVVVVTCDFFRAAFLDSHGSARLHLLAPSDAAGGRGGGAGLLWFRDRLAKLKSAKPARKSASVSPVKNQQFELARTGIALEGLFHTLDGEGATPWDEFMFVHNYFTLLFDHESTSSAPESWDVVRRALDHVEGDVELCLSWLDVATCETDLLQGHRRLVGRTAPKGQRGGAVRDSAKRAAQQRGVVQVAARWAKVLLPLLLIATVVGLHFLT